MTIDVNVSLFRWPTRRLPLDETSALIAMLRSRGVQQAWAGSFEALLHQDPAGVNLRLVQECSRAEDAFLLPFGTVNPMLPDWVDDLRRCYEVHGMRGIRVYPNYHGYSLDSAEFRQLAERVIDLKMLLQLTVRMEDPRTQHRLLAIPDVDLQPLESVLKELPSLRPIVLNGLMSSAVPVLAERIAAGEVSLDIATLEGIGGITRLLNTVPAEQILFGSHAPFFVWQAADLKLTESLVPQPLIERIRTGNARQLLADVGN